MLENAKRHLEWIGAVLSLGLKVGANLTGLERVELPLPPDLAVKGWFFAVLFVFAVALSISLAKQANRPFEQRRNSLVPVIAFGVTTFFVFPAAFWSVEYLWKVVDVGLADFMYRWLEPVVYGAVFGSLAAFLGSVLHQVMGPKPA